MSTPATNTQFQQFKASDQEPLNGQQMAALQKQFSNTAMELRVAMNLRKFCLELAAVKHDSPDTVIAVATAMYEFLTKPEAEIKITIS